jgi:multiple sugar transport system substrate-binding protein
VTVKFESLAQDDYAAKISLQLAGGDPPDMGWLLETMAANWIKAGALVDLGPKLKATAGYDFADLTPKAMGFWVRGDAVYAIPFSTSPFFTIYNADLFKAAGVDTPDVQIKNKTWTFENMAKAAKTIVDKNPKGTWGFSSPDGLNLYTVNLWINTTPFVRAYGGELWSDDYTTCMMNKKEAVTGLQLFQNMILVDKTVPPPGETAAFTAGNVGMSFGQLSRLGALKDAKFKWGFAPMPSGPAGWNPTIGQAAIGVFKAGKNAAVAADFAAFITNKDNVTKLATFWPPARLSVLNAEVVAKNNPTLDPASVKASITDSILAGKVVSSHPDFAKVELAARPFFDKIWVKDGKVQDQMDAACKALLPFLPK